MELADSIGVESSLDIEAFLDAVHDLLYKAWGQEWGEFVEQGTPVTDPSHGKPRITYRYVREVDRERTPAFLDWEEVPDPQHPGEFLGIRRLFLNCHLVFSVFAPSPPEAAELSRRFQLLLLRYEGYFQSLGLDHLFFLSETSSELVEDTGQVLYRREVTYLVRIQEILTQRYYQMQSLTVHTSVGGETLG